MSAHLRHIERQRGFFSANAEMSLNTYISVRAFSIEEPLHGMASRNYQFQCQLREERAKRIRLGVELTQKKIREDLIRQQKPAPPPRPDTDIGRHIVKPDIFPRVDTQATPSLTDIPGISQLAKQFGYWADNPLD